MKVYKYRSLSTLDRDLKILKRNQIYATPVKELNDPFEASCNEVISKLVIDLNPFPSFESSQLIKTMEDLSAHKDKIGVYSLSKIYTDQLLWALYSESYKGYCIEYDIEKLKSNYLSPKIVDQYIVKYEPEIPILTPEDIGQPTFIEKLYATKSPRWIDEEEIRLIFNSPYLKEYPADALCSICFGMRMPPKERRKIIHSIKNLDIVYYEIYMVSNSYKLERRKISKDIIEGYLKGKCLSKTDKSNQTDNLILEKQFLANWRLAVKEENISLGRIMIQNNIPGCGEYYLKRISVFEYLVACAPELNNWVYYLLNIKENRVHQISLTISKEIEPPRPNI